MSKLKIENTKFTVTRHPNAGKEYCVLTLDATIDGIKCKESIGISSNFLFEQADDTYRKQLLDDIITKLSYDIIVKSFQGIDKEIKKNYNSDNILKDMKSLYLPTKKHIT